MKLTATQEKAMAALMDAKALRDSCATIEEYVLRRWHPNFESIEEADEDAIKCGYQTATSHLEDPYCKMFYENEGNGTFWMTEGSASTWAALEKKGLVTAKKCNGMSIVTLV